MLTSAKNIYYQTKLVNILPQSYICISYCVSIIETFHFSLLLKQTLTCFHLDLSPFSCFLNASALPGDWEQERKQFLGC